MRVVSRSRLDSPHRSLYLCLGLRVSSTIVKIIMAQWSNAEAIGNNDPDATRGKFSTWVEELKQLVAAQRTKPSNDKNHLDARERVRVYSSTKRLHDEAKILLSNHWDRLARTCKPWKPTEALQRPYQFYARDSQAFRAAATRSRHAPTLGV